VEVSKGTTPFRIENFGVWLMREQGWYEDKASYDYNRKSNEEKERFFAELGLVKAFWSQ